MAEAGLDFEEHFTSFYHILPVKNVGKTWENKPFDLGASHQEVRKNKDSAAINSWSKKGSKRGTHNGPTVDRAFSVLDFRPSKFERHFDGFW